jgi:hypothetical protein
MATSISSITVRSRAVASRAPSRWAWSTAEEIDLGMTSPSGSSRRAPRARMEKSPSRRAESRLAMVCSGRTTRAPVFFQPAVEGAAAEAEFLGGLAGVAVAAGEGLLDEEGLDLLEAHVLEARRGLAGVEAEVGARTTLPCAISTPRSTEWSSSRTLPGQA